MSSEQSATRAVSIIGILECRKALLAVPAFLERAAETDSTVRKAAFVALRTLATPEHAREMVLALQLSETGSERAQADHAVATVLTQITNPDHRAEPVLAALREKPDLSTALFPLLGRIGGTNALGLLYRYLADSDPARHSAAFTGLSNWPDSAANIDLLHLAEKEPDPAGREQAVKALIRINTTPGDRPSE